MAAFYAYYFFLGGKERAHKRFGLLEGERQVAIYHASYIPEDNLKKDLALGVVGMKRRGMTMTVTLTDQGYLVLGNQENKSTPRRYLPHQIAVRDSSKEMSGRLAGPKGLEKIRALILVTPDAGEEHLAMVTSGVQALHDFAAQGAQAQASYGA